MFDILICCVFICLLAIWCFQKRGIVKNLIILSVILLTITLFLMPKGDPINSLKNNQIYIYHTHTVDNL